MDNIFLENINGWDSWGRVFQSIPAFENLIKRIFKDENLPCNKISHLTAGTNAVFKVDNYVVKIFAPIESGMDTETDYMCEMLGMKRATSLGIKIPNVIASSHVVDKYIFRYIIMEYINGTEAGKKFKCCSSDVKIDFVRQIKENINKMNTTVNEKYPTMNVKEKALLNTRWNVLSNKVNAQRIELIKDHNFTNEVYVHGDITGDNVIINQDGTLYILDFADGTIAPKEYEYGPILFDLFDFDKLMIHEFIGGQDVEEFAEKCFYGILIHEFGIYFVKLICERVLGMDASELTDILKLKEALVNLFEE